jgi:hypothetical protein
MIVLLRDKANRSSISIRTECDPGLAMIPADRVRLQQVLMNLMLNGIEAMKDTRGELTVISKKTADGQLLISVSDSGAGSPLIEPMAFSRRSSAPNRRAPASDCQSAGRLSSRMAAACGQALIQDRAQPFSSRWQPSLCCLTRLATSWVPSPFGMTLFFSDTFGGSISKCLRRYSSRKQDSSLASGVTFGYLIRIVPFPTLSVGPATTRTTKAVAKLQMLRSYEDARDGMRHASGESRRSTP